MQFEVLATCHTTRARVSRMKLARRFFDDIRIVLAVERFEYRRWGYPAAHIHAGGHAGGYQGSYHAADGVTWSHPDPQ